jgi:hypothetical protein
MKIKILISLVLLNIGCGSSGGYTLNEQYIDPNLQSYVNMFQSDMLAHNKNMPISTSVVFDTAANIVNITGSEYAIGVCEYSQLNKVSIDSAFWATASEIERKFLIYHELGHCVLNRVHRNDTADYQFCIGNLQLTKSTCPTGYWYDYQRPVSIMNAVIIPDWEVDDSTDAYVNELVIELFQ